MSHVSHPPPKKVCVSVTITKINVALVLLYFAPLLLKGSFLRARSVLFFAEISNFQDIEICTIHLCLAHPAIAWYKVVTGVLLKSSPFH